MNVHPSPAERLPRNCRSNVHWGFSLLFAIVLFICLPFLLAACGGPPEAEFTASVTSGDAPLRVSFANESKNADEFQWDFGDGTSTTSRTREEPVSHEYTIAGTHTVTLTAIKKSDPPQTSPRTLTMTVDPGSLNKVVLDTTQVALTPGEPHAFSVEILDRFDNRITRLAPTFRSEEEAGQVDADGRFTAGTVAGVYEDAVVVQVTEEGATKGASATITIKPGPLDHVRIEPLSATLKVTDRQQFAATACDQYENSIPELVFTFTSDEQAG